MHWEISTQILYDSEDPKWGPFHETGLWLRILTLFVLAFLSLGFLICKVRMPMPASPGLKQGHRGATVLVGQRVPALPSTLLPHPALAPAPASCLSLSLSLAALLRSLCVWTSLGCWGNGQEETHRKMQAWLWDLGRSSSGWEAGTPTPASQRTASAPRGQRVLTPGCRSSPPKPAPPPEPAAGLGRVQQAPAAGAWFSSDYKN